MNLVSQNGETYGANDLRYVSESGSLLDLTFSPDIDPEAFDDRPLGMWRYIDALPVDEQHRVSFDEGGTPLTEHRIGEGTYHLKQDHLFPSGSYKDRGASILISHAKALGVDSVVEDSSGNAGAAIAAYCARTNIQCDIYLPDSTSPAKREQIAAYGATLHPIPGSREDTADAAISAAEGRFYASHVYNPFFFHGTKTFAYEVWEQLGRRAPDEVLIPTGNGTLLIGAHIGFSELKEAGLIDQMPKLVAVQAENCSPLFEIWSDGLDALPENATSPTKAEGIAIAAPVRWRQIVEIIRSTGGEIVTVTEDEIKSGYDEMAAAGWFIEPTSASAIATARKRPGPTDGIVVVPVTGHGLKASGKS